MKRQPLQLPDTIYDDTKKWAKINGLTMTQYVRMILSQHHRDVVKPGLERTAPQPEQ